MKHFISLTWVNGQSEENLYTGSRNRTRTQSFEMVHKRITICNSKILVNKITENEILKCFRAYGLWFFDKNFTFRCPSEFVFVFVFDFSSSCAPYCANNNNEEKKNKNAKYYIFNEIKLSHLYAYCVPPAFLLLSFVSLLLLPFSFQHFDTNASTQ